MKQGGIGELITGLRVVARLHASGDFVRVNVEPSEPTPGEEGWGRELRARLLACTFVPPLFLATLEQFSIRPKLVFLLTGMLLLFLVATCIPVMLKRFQLLTNYYGHRGCSPDDRVLGGVVVLLLCAGLGAGASVLMSAALHS